MYEIRTHYYSDEDRNGEDTMKDIRSQGFDRREEENIIQQESSMKILTVRITVQFKIASARIWGFQNPVSMDMRIILDSRVQAERLH